MAGVGKTALAAHAAYQLRSQFPDGVLWANVAHANPLAILSAFAGAYGQDVSRYPDVESRSQAVRALLADKQALLVLDDVHHSEVVYPLLPPTGRCAVIITTQRHDLAITQGVQRLHLYGFDQATNEAQQLFSRILGEEYVAQNAVACAAIADRVGHLPLAVALAAGLLASDPQWRPAALFADLAQDQSCLSVLAQDDQNLWVPFDLSYQALTATQRIFFCALSVFGGADFGVASVAAAAQSSTATTHDQLRQLYSCSLVQQGRAGRYRLHPLLQMFAQHL